MKLRSLFLAVAGALILMACIVPRANANPIVYFNFEDVAPEDPHTNGTLDGAADVFPANPGGGQQNSTLTMNNYTSGGAGFGTGPALAIAGTNRTAADNDLTNNSALVMNRTSKNDGAFLQFGVNTIGLTQLSLSFAVDNNGNGFNTVTLQYSTTPAGVYSTVFTFNLTTGPNQLLISSTFNVTQSATGTFRLVFSGGQSNGNNRETAIDNIQLNAIPEPATVLGGLLGACGLCWHQRRRLIRSLRLRRA